MAETEYRPVEIALDDTPELPDVHLDVLGMKLDLPNLNSAELPLEVVQAVLLVKSKTVLDDATAFQATSVFLAYFEHERPNFWGKLKATDRPIAWINATVKAWAEQSGIDPKALS